ncbi:hypothetical protein H4R18_000462 [Coemansia javaensis]|uniref:Major facilitator superfamily (MFS) profile domain-containing protein n=1 Tax=Coemansia javaensis TaxID=2761396 RepID=A0A9W8HHY8_9FUNG|nr:hypothetical protein H4R18_000462 [Coemansia javaensis]
MWVLLLMALQLVLTSIDPLGAMNGVQQLSSSTAQFVGPPASCAMLPNETPLPWGQLWPLIAVRLAEPINLSLILPFLYKMVSEFDVVKSPEDVSFYAGLLFTSYSASQAITVLYWGPLSDRIGRRPTLLMGLAGDLVTFVLFGLSKSFWWALATRTLNGFFAGNAAVVKSVIVEIADDTNRPRMMALVPFMWHVGVMGGAAVGGLLADPVHQYPGLFGGSELFRTYPYLLPCLAGSLTTAVGLVVGLLRLEETLDVKQPARPALAEESRPASESTPLIPETQAQAVPKASLWTPTTKRVLAIAWVLALATSMCDQLTPIFLATAARDGGLGFSPRNIGFSMAITGVAVVYMQLVLYPRLARKHGALKCFRLGSLVMAPQFVAMPFLSLLARRVERLMSARALLLEAQPGGWRSQAGLEYALLWVLLAALLLQRMVGNVMAFTSVNLIVSNIAPCKAMLGTVNGLQQFGATLTRIVGPVISGTLWGWSLKHGLPYPLDSHLVWLLCAAMMLATWWLSLPLPASVNALASGQRSTR